MAKLSVMNKKVVFKQPELPEGLDSNPYVFPTDLSSERAQIEMEIIECIQEIYDPELPINLFDLGLIYKIDISESRDVLITMTLTTANCPVAQSLPEEVKQKTMKIERVNEVEMLIAWDPPWNRGMMSEEARLDLNL